MIIEAFSRKQMALVAAIIVGATVSGYVVPIEAAKLVQTNDIANGAITTPKVANGAVTLAKLGFDVPSHLITKVVGASSGQPVAAGQLGAVEADCPSGMILVGGSGSASAGQTAIPILSESPLVAGTGSFSYGENGDTPNAWYVQAYNTSTNGMIVTSTAICGKMVP